MSIIIENDSNAFKELVESLPETLSICDNDSNNLLQLSIIYNRYETFLYLLSLDFYNLEEENVRRQTALMLSLSVKTEDGEFLIENFAIDLINKGANIHTLCEDNNTVLHLALSRHQFLVSKLLIEKGADINFQNSEGDTPLHMIFQNKTNPEGILEGVGLLLYYGADTSICDHNQNLPFELAVLYDPKIIVAQENLFFSTFDEYSQYEMSLEVLIELLETRSPLIFQIADYVKGVSFMKSFLRHYNPTLFFKLEPEFLNLIIDKFPDVIKAIFSLKIPLFWYNFSAVTVDNWEILLNSCVASDVVNFIRKLRMEFLIETLHGDGTPEIVVAKFIYYLLSYGLEVTGRDMQCVYQLYGYSQFFKVLLHMEIQPSVCDILPRYIYDVQLELDVFLDDPYNYSLKAIEELLDLFARRKLKNFCYRLDLKKLKIKAESLPEVPLLVELARDASRTYLVKHFNIQNSSQFYSLLKQLPLSVYHRRILAFETKLYK